MTGSVVPERPSKLEWMIAIYSAIVQQGAFLSIPLYFGTTAIVDRQEQNELNTIAVAVSMVLVIGACIPIYRSIIRVLADNLTSVAFSLMVFLSVVWSIHPNITIRRGVGYGLTLLFAAFLSARFDINQCLKVLSWSFAISAGGSVLFILIFPNDGIMNVAELTGNWRGVFPHKNVLGPTMATGIFVQSFILCAKGPSKWHAFLLLFLLFLVVMAHSATGLVIAAIFIFGSILYITNTRSRLAAAVFAALLVGTSAAVLLIYLFDSDAALQIIGKDPTLTGRTAVWDIVLRLIAERPVLGYGYRATWVLSDASTELADRAVGGWGLASSHSGFLELALQLGYVGCALMVAIIVTGFIKAIDILKFAGLLGFFSIVYFVATLFSSLTMETLGQNQLIQWFIFNVLLFNCSKQLRLRRELSGWERPPRKPMFYGPAR